MGVYIPGAKKPDDCDECFIRQSNLAYCQLTHRSTSHYPSGKEIKGIPNYCPLVEVKEPHGRLIDADKIAIYHQYPWSSEQWVTDKDIERTPTVIEAEGE